MKRYFLFVTLFLIIYRCHAQGIGIGTDSIEQSAILHIRSFDRGILIPRMTNAQMNAVADPAEGLPLKSVKRLDERR